MARNRTSTRTKERQPAAENARTRRTTRSSRERTVPHAATSRRTASVDHSVPPVMVRGGMEMPWQAASRTKSRPRRRYDVTLNMPGAEMRLPAIPQVAFGWRAISFALTVAMLALLYYLWNSPSYQIEKAQIAGLQRLNSRDVNTLIAVRGESVFAIDPDAVREKLLSSFPEFASVSVRVSLPADLNVTVQERQPLLTWHQGDRTILIDASGTAFPLRNESDQSPPLVVEATGAPAMANPVPDENGHIQFMPVEMISAIVSMSAQAPPNTPLVYDPQRGLGWKDTQGWSVYFGNASQMDLKLRVYKAMVAQLQKNRITPTLISVEHVNLPYYRTDGASQ